MEVPFNVVLPPERFDALYREYKLTKSKDIQQLLVSSFYGMFFRLARKYKTPSLQLDDIFQECVVGFIKHLHSYNPDLNYKPSTYFFPVVKGHILRYIANTCRIIRLPAYLQTRESTIKIEFEVFGDIDLDRLGTYEQNMTVNVEKTGIEKNIVEYLETLDDFQKACFLNTLADKEDRLHLSDLGDIYGCTREWARQMTKKVVLAFLERYKYVDPQPKKRK